MFDKGDCKEMFYILIVDRVFNNWRDWVGFFKIVIIINKV